jgi:hypothetical protein
MAKCALQNAEAWLRRMEKYFNVIAVAKKFTGVRKINFDQKVVSISAIKHAKQLEKLRSLH